MKKKVGILFLLFCLVFSVMVYAAPNENTDEISETPVLSEAEQKLQDFYTQANNKNREDNVPIMIIKAPKEMKTTVNENGEEVVEPGEDTLFFALSEEQLLFNIEDPEYDLWMEAIKENVKEDALNGLSVLSNTDVTIDHIKLETWGKFFNDYYGKTNTNFPVGSIVLEYGDYSFTILNTKDAKEFFLNYFMKPLITEIENVAKAYPAKRYRLEIDSGTLLKDYECDLTSVKELKTVYPFDGVEEYVFYNVGSYYGMSLGKDYVDILRGYIEGSNTGYDRPVKGDVPGCVNVLSYITLLRNVSNNTLSDKVLSDFVMYQNLAICLDTKELIDTTDMTTTNKALIFSDYKLNPDNLVLAPISDTVVIIQPTYLECFYYNGIDRNFGRRVDATDFITTGNPNLTVTTQEGVVNISISYFCDSNGYIDTRLGNAPFLVYYTSYVPYDLIINWAYNQSSGIIDEETQEKLISHIREEMKSLGRSEDFNTYVKAAGQMTDTVKTIIKVVIGVVVLIAIIVVVVIILKKKKNANSPVSTSRNNNVLFEDDNLFDDDNDDDDDFGSFEIK